MSTTNNNHDEENANGATTTLATQVTKKGNEYSNEYVLNFAFCSFVLFTAVQFVFALVARSQSMLTDCSAMTVDCVSYLINFLAERMKHSTTNNHDNTNDNNDNNDNSSNEQGDVQYRKKLKLLLLELAPPLFSATTLVVVTVMSIQQAVQVILDTDPNDPNPKEPPNLRLMLLFSALNGVLDAVNVLCFAKAEQGALAKGIASVLHPKDFVCELEHQHEQDCHLLDNKPRNHETTPLLRDSPKPMVAAATATEATITDSDLEEDASTFSSKNQKNGAGASGVLNLNMCSAWTHICADTLRSIAVLVAAGLAYLLPLQISPADADSYGAIVVSIIIIISLGPLMEGIYFTAWEIYYLQRDYYNAQSQQQSQQSQSQAL